MNKRNRKIIQLQANAARKALKYVKHTKFIDQYWRYTVDWGDSKRIDRRNNTIFNCLHTLKSLSDNKLSKITRLMLNTEGYTAFAEIGDEVVFEGHSSYYKEVRSDPSWAFFHWGNSWETKCRMAYLATKFAGIKVK